MKDGDETASEKSEVDEEELNRRKLLQETQVGLNFFRNYLNWYAKHSVSQPNLSVQAFGQGKTGWIEDTKDDTPEKVEAPARRYNTRRKDVEFLDDQGDDEGEEQMGNDKAKLDH